MRPATRPWPPCGTRRRRCKVWLLIGSLGLKTRSKDGRFANRSFLIGPDGGIAARYDKIHMFDVNVSETEVYRESAAYRPGSRAVLAPTPFGGIGMTVCYDVRFPQLYRKLAQAGAQIITVPAAFNHITGAAHWEALLRARAIETGCLCSGPGADRPSCRNGRQGAPHPWPFAWPSRPGARFWPMPAPSRASTFVDLDLAEVDRARARIPSLVP